MSVFAHNKWQPQCNCICIEKFYYTRDGRHCGVTDRRPPESLPEFTWHEGRIMLDKGREGRFFVDWSTIATSIKSPSLAELRQGLVDYLDGIRTKSDVSCIDTWDLCIYWAGNVNSSPHKVRVKCDEKGNVIRYAAWDEKRQEFVVGHPPYNINLSLEPYTEIRWKEAVADTAVRQAYQRAEHTFEGEMTRFSYTRHDPVLLQVLKAQTKAFDKHRKTLEARLEELQRKEKEKKETK